MSSWVEDFQVLKNYAELSQAGKLKNTLTVETFIHGLAGWLDTSIAEYTEGAWEAVSRRAVWVYPNELMLTIGTSITPTLSYLNVETHADDKAPLPSTESRKNWSWVYNINGWASDKNFTVEELAILVDRLTQLYGEPKLCLPWVYKVEGAVDEGEDYYSYWDTEDEEHVLYKSFYELAVLIAEDKIGKISPWVLEITDEDGYMSEYSKYSKFRNLVNELEESGEWLVILDEHCAACASGTRTSYYDSDPTWKSKPEFMTWGQNSQDSWLPNGEIYADVWLEEFRHGVDLMQKANKHGFNFEIPSNEDDYTGSVVFE